MEVLTLAHLEKRSVVNRLPNYSTKSVVATQKISLPAHLRNWTRIHFVFLLCCQSVCVWMIKEEQFSDPNKQTLFLHSISHPSVKFFTPILFYFILAYSLALIFIFLVIFVLFYSIVFIVFISIVLLFYFNLASYHYYIYYSCFILFIPSIVFCFYDLFYTIFLLYFITYIHSSILFIIFLYSVPYLAYFIHIFSLFSRLVHHVFLIYIPLKFYFVRFFSLICNICGTFRVCKKEYTVSFGECCVVYAYIWVCQPFWNINRTRATSIIQMMMNKWKWTKYL